MVLNSGRDTFIKNAKELLGNGLGTSQFFLDENESMFGRRNGKKCIKVITITDVVKRVSKNLNEIGNNDIVKESGRSANDVKSRLNGNDIKNFNNIGDNFAGRKNESMWNFPRNMPMKGVLTTKVFVLSHASLFDEFLNGYIGRRRSHANNLVWSELFDVERSSSKLYKFDVIVIKRIELNKLSNIKGIVNGLSLRESDLIFINDNKSGMNVLDMIGKLIKRIAMIDTMVKRLRESFLSLFKPFDGRVSSDDKDMVERHSKLRM